jgi:tryptophan synthase alpha chain
VTGPATAPDIAMGPIESSFRAARERGRKLLVPYVMGGLTADWVDAVQAVAAAGADAVEVGLPFSDPVMDGPTIQEAAERALARGATPAAILDAVAGLDVGVPLVVMTYYNLAFHAGPVPFARALAGAGFSGAIVPDLPLEEMDEWAGAATEAGLETVLLAAPTTPDDRLNEICRRSRGWVYGVALLGVTGERATLSASAAVMGRRLKAVTDMPVLMGLGVSTAEQAVQACAEADGVIVGSALVRRLVEGAGAEGAGEFVAGLRAGLDAGKGAP